MAHRHYYAYNGDDDERSTGWRRPVIGIAIAVVLALAAAGYWVLGFSAEGSARMTTAESTQPDATPALVDSTSVPTTTVAPSTTTSPTRPVAGTATASTPSTTQPSTTTTEPEPPTSATLPDGSAAPVVAIFDVATITLAGAVPSEAARTRLSALALANSKTPAAVIDLLTIDPTVPEGVGVRVVELTSSRFPEGSSEIVMAHAAELNRIATVMSALPNVSVLVVGHADQIGSEAANFALSEERAQAVVSYLVDAGVEPSRLSSRAVGESDLLSVDSDETSLALNRRTEFIVYGALIEAAA
jgi:outer membrane protein OmpA-like peptidoglycan-associated protein